MTPHFRPTPLLFLSLALLFLSPGCAKRGGSITLESTGREQSLTQEFHQAYIAAPRAGEYDIILVDSGANWQYRKPRKDRPLEPTPLAPLRQVMHIHCYWKPLAGVTKNPAAINASIDWYVLGPDGSNDILVYSGAGLVHLNGKRVDIRDGRLRPKLARGQMQDPIGVARLSGSVVTRPDKSKVVETIAEMQDTAAGATPVAKTE